MPKKKSVAEQSKSKVAKGSGGSLGGWKDRLTSVFRSTPPKPDINDDPVNVAFPSPTSNSVNIPGNIHFSPNPNNTANIDDNNNTIPENVDWSSLLVAFKTWEETNQQSTFMKKLAKLDDVVQMGAVQSLIDSIPVVHGATLKALVKAITNVLHVAIAFPDAKSDVCDFVKETLEGIIDYMSVMADLEGCQSETAQKNFKRISGAVNQICIWANEQLNRRVNMGRLPNEDLNKWREKLRVTKEQYILEFLKAKDIRDRIKDTKENIRRTLENRVAIKVRYDEQEKRTLEVFPGTREDIIRRVILCVEDPMAERFCWITGHPGAGKSTLAVHITGHLKRRGLLCAQYFVTRNIQQTTSAERVLPSIALQLAEAPLAARVIEKALPTISTNTDRLSDKQAEAFLLDPLKKMAEERSTRTFHALRAIMEEGVKNIVLKCRNDITTESIKEIADVIVREFQEKIEQVAGWNQDTPQKRSVLKALAEELVKKAGQPVNGDTVKIAQDTVIKMAERSVCQMVVLVIDALDELQEAKDLASILSKLACELPKNVKVILTSRPENDIISALRSSVEVKKIDLQTKESIEEVGKYIHAKLTEYAGEQNPKWKNWPPETLTKTLSENANGLFHYGATVVAWIITELTKMPSKRDNLPEKMKPFYIHGGLGDLYNHVLVEWAKDSDVWVSVPPEDGKKYGKIMDKDENTNRYNIRYVKLDPEKLECLHCLLQILISLEDPLDIIAIGTLCKIGGGLETVQDATTILRQLRSLLVHGHGDIKHDTIPDMHKSFREYITSDWSGHFCINATKSHLVTAKACMQMVVNISNGQCDSASNGYAKRYWAQHLYLSSLGADASYAYSDKKVMKLINAMASPHFVAYGLQDNIEDICKVGWVWMKANSNTHPSLEEALNKIHTIVKESYNKLIPWMRWPTWMEENNSYLPCHIIIMKGFHLAYQDYMQKCIKDTY